MTTAYEFAAGFKKAGQGAWPSSAATITVIDSANNVLVAAATATTALSNLVGAYRYSYSGADGLTCYAKFTTTDLTMDEYELFCIPNINPVVRDVQTRLPSALTANGNMKSSLLEIIANTISETSAGYLAAGFKKFFDKATPTGTINSIPDALPNGAGGLLITAAGALDMDEMNVDIEAIQTNMQTLGAGSKSTPITINDGVNPLDGVDVWATTDVGGTNVVARGYTNAVGLVTFMLDPATYFIWKTLSGYTFTNPSTLAVV